MSQTCKQFAAIIVTIAIWFSCHVSGALQAAPSNPDSVANGCSVEVTDAAPVPPPLSDTIPGVDWMVTGSLIAAAVLIGYNLLTKGKRGWGWFVVCVMIGVVAFVAKIGIAMFCEVSSANEGPTDWDSD